jgi:hypothetical protein
LFLGAAEEVTCSQDETDAYASLVRAVKKGEFSDKDLFVGVRSRMVLPIQRYFHPEQFRARQ